MSRSLLPVAALLFGAALLYLSGGMVGLLLPLRGTSEGMSALWLGLLGTGWAIGYVTGCLRVPRLVANVGHVRAFGVMCSLASLSVLGSLLLIEPIAWILMRAVTGFAFAGASMIVESWLVERSEAKARGRVFGVYSMVTLGTSTLGQLSLSLGDSNGPVYFVVAAMLLSLSLIPTAISSSSTPSPLLDTRLDLKGMWARSPLAMVGCVLIGVSNATFGTLAAVYADRLQMPVGVITLFVSLPVLAGTLAQVPIGLLSDRFDRRRVLAGIALVALCADLGFVLLQPTTATLVIPLAMVFGAMAYTMYPVIVAHANDHATSSDTIRVSATLLLLFGLGSIAGPLVAGAFMTWSGPRGLFFVTAGAHVLLIGYALWRMTRRAAVEDADKGTFRVQAAGVMATPQTSSFRTAEDGELVHEGIDPASGEHEGVEDDEPVHASPSPAT